MKSLTEKQANAIWALLVEEGGANEHSRQDFVWQQIGDPISEWRFQGHFGFGGKFYHDHDRWFIDYYPEDDTLERSRLRDEINVKLAKIKSLFEEIDRASPEMRILAEKIVQGAD